MSKFDYSLHNLQQEAEPAQVCLHGHVINVWAKQHESYNRAFCKQCGAATIQKCPRCKGIIIGGQAMSFAGQSEAPSFCVHCGNPMPWTEEAIQRTEELYDLIDDLTPEEKRALKSCLPDLVRDTPASPIAALKTGKILKRVEPHFREMFKQLMSNLLAAKIQAILKAYGF